MTQRRQDSWTYEEDLLLATTVLDYIKNGNTQLNAFAVVAKKLNRTASACGFRWNATVRDQYKKQIKLAKEKSRKKPLMQQKNYDETYKNLKEAIILLKKVSHNLTNIKGSDEKEEVNKLREENAKLKDQIIKQQNAYKHIQSLLKEVQEEQLYKSK